jgi:hypothetical protein
MQQKSEPQFTTFNKFKTNYSDHSKPRQTTLMKNIKCCFEKKIEKKDKSLKMFIISLISILSPFFLSIIEYSHYIDAIVF